jgi:hypothetical protein
MADGKTGWIFSGILLTMGLTFMLGACSDTPTEANSPKSPLPVFDVVTRDTAIAAAGSSTFKEYVVMDGAANLIGRSGNYSASALIEFYQAYFPIRDTAKVFSAKLTLQSIYWFGDPTGSIAFDVYSINSPWSSSTFTGDTLVTGFYDPSVIRGTYSSTAGPDTQQVVINLDTAMVRSWLSTSGASANYGVILVPNAASNVVRGLHQFDSDSAKMQPTLQIIAGNVAGTVFDTTSYTLGMDTFVGNIDNLATDPTLLYAQSGVVYRSLLNFDVSFIPRGAIINAAELQLVRNRTASRIDKFTTDTVVYAHVALNSSVPPSIENEVLASPGRRMTDSASTFSFDIRHAVQTWLTGPNYGLLLRAGNTQEFSSFSLYTFYNQRAGTGLRPRLRIVYSMKKL